ncbi:GGDEF domain-containing protein [Rhodococcoides yunnanense]|uniref:GGDEF domain-containing protein n=1 Tax=Rhodococcoides yunnanense TaxID=278209 RepID=UPI000932281C|nr:GGDEF domain-containing protein [Rhodococcus yunnanensis]
MRLLYTWWAHPADYAWTSSYHRADPLLRRADVALGTWCWMYAALCILGTHTPAGAPDGAQRVLALVLAGSSTVIGILWVLRRWPSENVSRLFVLYLELSAAAALLMLSDPFVALPCAAALGVNGSYIAAFHSQKLFLAHQIWVAALVGVLFVSAVTAPGADVVLACAYLVMLTLVLFSAPVLTQAFLLLLRRDAATSLFDPLTGLRNRRGLDVAIGEYGVRLDVAVVMVIDLDRFKQVNDRFGHAHGDVVLRSTAGAIDAAFPPPSITARTGGEEFVVVARIAAAEAIERARTLQASFIAHAGTGTTVSIGIAHAPDSGFRRAWEKADAAMYDAKKAGGNTVHIAAARHSDAPEDTDNFR